MRLFRQLQRGNWRDLLQRVAQMLREAFPATEEPAAHPAEAPGKTAASSAPGLCLNQLLAPVSLGELMDKISILEIKQQHLEGLALSHVQIELKALQTTLADLNLNLDPALIQRLREVNETLWQIEDAIREKERSQDFSAAFIQLARSVYQQNDRRADLKKEINQRYGSLLVEEKCYHKY